jgi:hypothetical protein
MSEQRYQIITQNKRKESEVWDEPTFVFVGNGDLDAAQLEFDQELGMFLVEETLDPSNTKIVMANRAAYTYTLLGFEFQQTSAVLFDTETSQAVRRE